MKRRSTMGLIPIPPDLPPTPANEQACVLHELVGLAQCKPGSNFQEVYRHFGDGRGRIPVNLQARELTVSPIVSRRGSVSTKLWSPENKREREGVSFHQRRAKRLAPQTENHCRHCLWSFTASRLSTRYSWTTTSRCFSPTCCLSVNIESRSSLFEILAEDYSKTSMIEWLLTETRY